MDKIELRNSQPADVDAVLAYLDAHRHHHHIGRHRDHIAEAVEARRFILAYAFDEKSIFINPLQTTMVGVAGLFPFPRYPASAEFPNGDGPEPPWRELGSARVIMNGFGLHRLLIAARIAHDSALSPGAEAQFSVVYDNDVTATATHISAGFTPWTPPPELATLWAEACNVSAPIEKHGPRGFQFMALPRVGASQLIHSLLRCDSPDFMLIRPASQAYGAAKAAGLRLTLDCLRSHRAELTLLAQVDAVHGRLQSVQALGEKGSIF